MCVCLLFCKINDILGTESLLSEDDRSINHLPSKYNKLYLGIFVVLINYVLIVIKTLLFTDWPSYMLVIYDGTWRCTENAYMHIERYTNIHEKLIPKM